MNKEEKKIYKFLEINCNKQGLLTFKQNPDNENEIHAYFKDDINWDRSTTFKHIWFELKSMLSNQKRPSFSGQLFCTFYKDKIKIILEELKENTF